MQARAVEPGQPLARAGSPWRFADALRRSADVVEARAEFWNMSERHVQLLRAHRPGQVRAALTHLRASQGLSGGDLPFPLKGSVEVREVPGDHFSVLSDESAVRSLAARLAACLETCAGPLDDESAIRELTRRFMHLSCDAKAGSDVVDAFFARDARALLIDGPCTGREVAPWPDDVNLPRMNTSADPAEKRCCMVESPWPASPFSTVRRQSASSRLACGTLC